MTILEALEKLSRGEHIDMHAQGNSMRPVYSDGDAIRVFPFTEDRGPQIGDTVFFFMGSGFNRHRLNDIEQVGQFTFYEITDGAGRQDGYVTRDALFGYVVPHKDLGIEDATEAGTTV
jgi:signal peptidase I